ncbi:MAG: prenyltransferase/squalene oxidase repeat-containing protein [Methanobacteriota archaeon]
MKSKTALDWLLEDDQPSVRYLALRHLRGSPEDDPEIRSARGAIPTRGWAAGILADQNGGGWWVGEESLYRPKYLSSNWMLLILSDLGLTRSNPRIAKACDLWIERFAREDGGFAMEGMKRSHLCIVGNTARALVKFGYADDPRVRSAFEWLAENRDKNGGWSCFGSGRNLDSWEGMSAFAVYPRQKWTAAMGRAVELGAEFYLQRELHKQGSHYEPWYRFHYPVHYYYDLLVGLEFMTALGYGDDSRLRTAISVLKDRRRADGRWNLDAIHPDLEGKTAEWYAKHPTRSPTPFALERPGEPSKMITLRATVVLERLTRDGGVG